MVFLLKFGMDLEVLTYETIFEDFLALIGVSTVTTLP